MISAEWQRLMDAPWGKHTPQAIEAKTEALAQYRHSLERFWTAPGRPGVVPALPTEDRSTIAVPIESWVPRLAPAFAEFANDVRRG